MGKIFCLMGKSSSGKDTLFRNIKEHFKEQLMPIVSYTTRPMRAGERQGEEYHFINEEVLKEYDEQGKIIEQRMYRTVSGPWYYATIDDGSIDLKAHSYMMIVTLESYNSLVKYYGQESIIPIYIEVEDGLRLERALMRERRQAKPQYEELCRRFLADNQDFSIEKLKQAGINHTFINNDMQNCLDEINGVINQELALVATRID